MTAPIAPALAGTDRVREERSTSLWTRRLLCLFVPLVVAFTPLPVDPLTKNGLAVAAFVILAWMTEIMDPAIAGLVGCYLYWVLKIVPFEVAFSGFASQTSWFAFGATLFGAMTVKSGLGRRLALVVLRHTGSTYPRILLGLIVASLLLTLLVPSGAARVVIMATVALGIVEALGIGPRNPAARGMFLAITYGAGLFDKMIIAGTALITAQGLMEQVAGVEVLWSRWMIAFLPGTLATVPIMWLVTLRLLPCHADLQGAATYVKEETDKLHAWTLLEKKTAVLMLTAVALWMTDFAHALSPQMIGLGVGLCAVLPGIGILTGEDMKRLNYLPVFFVAAAVSLGEVLTHTKGLDVLSQATFTWMEPLMTNVFSTTAVLYWSAFVYHLFLGSEVSMLATSIPVLMRFALTHGMDPIAVGMVWTFAAGGKIFVYQSAVLVIGYSYGFFQGRDLLRFGAWLTIAEFLILMLLRILYWPLIGLH